MRRSHRGSLFRPLALGVAMTLTVPGVAHAEPGPGPNTIAGLIADVADANQRLQDVGARVQAEQESVNKAIVDVQTARDAAAAAQEQVDVSAAAVKDSNAAIADAQKRFDELAVAAYMNGPSSALLMASTPEEIISTASATQALTLSSQQVITDLQRARTEQVNKESAARLAKEKADQAVAEAEASQQNAVAALTQAQKTFGDQQAEIDRLAAERKTAQDKLAAAREWSAPANSPAAVPQSAATGPATPGDRWDPAAPGSPKAPNAGVVPPYGSASEWDTTLPMVPSAFVSGDPIQIINAVLQISSSSLNATKQMGKSFLQKLGILKPDDTGITNGAIPYVYGAQASEYVIKRAMSQMGVPYSWGGGTATGPGRGIDSGAGTVGFDCSGLILYAFAGVGIKLPHYSGSQYNMGRKIPSSQMRRGDVIFYGPGGSQHVTLYLGQGQMLEAPYTGSNVKISPVRTSGMTPFVIRYIEY
ncbi:cell wall-associated NlpC family hydrolase [Mycolicibacterium sp. BK556]|uniref:NlpC/P60 family peptidoglycan endopeptidase RipA n=1 Tax=Mycobacteriaceae TaxID=1762 RepID=UPI00105F596C|nr:MULTISPECIES: NlpC/P60 family peptidoglycan endopeptidase RipA [Mycobacteriaceae]MBB3606706.1 cell wall-associated NlpC family hydrolase [Mycolicibacterium sp. BK556]MBB3636628.1 cell wall-associated NlpC family hydrolase [Mycolicibacterium sp. BK607]MBB3754286.1 cell wall-associated NlpC family hydrolase [Mycolicibacterium sp. BK634]TDO17072.1 cell wall-associated NlpC family hydrolase [Mycobacterium sp. BK086]